MGKRAMERTLAVSDGEAGAHTDSPGYLDLSAAPLPPDGPAPAQALTGVSCCSEPADTQPGRNGGRTGLGKMGELLILRP
jgi:hypothetical protein